MDILKINDDYMMMMSEEIIGPASQANIIIIYIFQI